MIMIIFQNCKKYSAQKYLFLSLSSLFQDRRHVWQRMIVRFG